MLHNKTIILFQSVLSQQYDKHPIIILKDVKYAELRAMMDYMYRGEVNISQDQLAALLKAAESLQIKGLSDNKPSRPPSRPAPPAAAHPPRAPSPPPQVLPSPGYSLRIAKVTIFNCIYWTAYSSQRHHCTVVGTKMFTKHYLHYCLHIFLKYSLHYLF